MGHTSIHPAAIHDRLEAWGHQVEKGAAPPSSDILNQNVFDQCPGRFRICAGLSASETQGSLVYRQADDSTAVYGLVSRGEQMTNKGNMTSVQGLAEVASYSGQSGSVGEVGSVPAPVPVRRRVPPTAPAATAQGSQYTLPELVRT